jgi:hypothetical protein
VASLKEASHAADLGRRLPAILGLAAQSVTSENNPNSVGVVRAMARSDHCRCVSTPRCALRKRGFAVERIRNETKGSLYRIANGPNAAAGA